MPYLTSISNPDNEPVYEIGYTFNRSESQEILNAYFENSESYNILKEKYPQEDYILSTVGKMTITVYKRQPVLIGGMS